MQKAKPLRWYQPTRTSVAIPVFVFIVINFILLGQSQTSFEIVADAPFTNTSLRSVIEPRLANLIQIPNITFTQPVNAAIVNIGCDSITVGEAWLLTTNGPDLWVNISDLRLECRATYTWALPLGPPLGGDVRVQAERSAFAGQLLVERMGSELHLSLEACQVSGYYPGGCFWPIHADLWLI